MGNAKGVEIAASVDELHTEPNKINKETALDEKGNLVKGRGDEPNQHDILTGTQQDGTAFPAGEDRTCSTGRLMATAPPWSATTT